MPEPYVLGGGSIGATQPELSRYILDSDEVLNHIIKRLQGHVLLTKPDGTSQYVQVERKYNEKCLAWIRGKLEEILNKNLYLSQYKNQDEMLKEARHMIIGFCDELFYNAKDFNLSVEQFEELRHMYSNFLSQAIRRPLYESDKNFLRHTTSETTQKIQQNISQEQEKRGFFSGLFGKK